MYRLVSATAFIFHLVEVRLSRHTRDISGPNRVLLLSRFFLLQAQTNYLQKAIDIHNLCVYSLRSDSKGFGKGDNILRRGGGSHSEGGRNPFPGVRCEIIINLEDNNL